MAPYMPDWLGNLTADASGLVDDSPQFRRREQDQQMMNLNNAANAALHQVRVQTEEAQRRAAQAGLHQLHAMTPVQNPVGDIPVLSPQEPQNVPTQDEFNMAESPVTSPQLSSNTQMPPQQPQTPGELQETQNPVAMVQHIAATLGMTPQQVAALSMLGADIRENKNQQILQQKIQAQQNPPTTPIPSASQMPMPTQMLPPSPQASPGQQPTVPPQQPTPVTSLLPG